MKKESLDEVKNLINYINKNELKFDKETINTFRRSLNMIMFMEVNSPKIGKFDIFKFTANDELRPILSCVHYEDGMCSATDGKMIVRTKIGYKEEFDGKNISRIGREIDERYPNVNSVIPNVTKSHTEYEVDFDLIDAYVKSGKIWAQTNRLPKSKIENHLVINFHGAYLRLMKLQVLCTAMKAIGMNSLYVNKDNLKAVFMKNDDNEVVIINPLMPDEKYKDVNEYFYCEIN